MALCMSSYHDLYIELCSVHGFTYLVALCLETYHLQKEAVYCFNVTDQRGEGMGKERGNITERTADVQG
jgi:hypothetical protein